ncbi:acyltransferase family protein [Pseudonocardia sp. CA-107938]|uniref:acyltransferase family protein n=1 Tax=Pseudonocardia sp. CA-107938 TaxID=3240021 RepID=UPI003D949C59
MAISMPFRDAVTTARYEAALTVTQPLRVVQRGRHSRRALARQAGRRGDGRRLPTLDGLRGVAALVVLVHHAFLSQPALAAPYLDPRTADDGGVVWWLTWTPLHLVWAGTEAVFVFFVLSGLVLTLPAMTGRLRLRAYYAARLLRLYPPVWAAVALAVGVALLVPRVWPEGASWWMVAMNQPVTPRGVAADLTLLVAPGAVNHVLWSLQWEMVFSLLLPVFVVVAVSRRVAWSHKIAAALAAVGAAAVFDSVAVSALAMFLLGSLLASGRAHVDYAAAVIEGQRRPTLCWALVGLLAAVLLSAYWLVNAPGWDLPADHPLVALTRALQALGACLVVAIAWYCPGARRVLSSRVAQWLGARSFSLYLVHLPLVSATVLLLGGTPPLWAVLLISVPAALLATALFHRVIEQPSHRLARRAAARLAAGPVRAGSITR